jgi:hypothetical protein
MTTSLRMTFWFWLGSLAFWLAAGVLYALLQGGGVMPLVIALGLSGMSALMFAEGSVSWSYSRRQFPVTSQVMLTTLASGAASGAFTLAVGTLLNVFWSLMLTRMSILPALVLTVLVWYVGTVVCCAWLYGRFDVRGKEGSGV